MDWTTRSRRLIGLFEPSHDLLHDIQEQLKLHPLAIEDAGKPHQHPNSVLFIVARTAQIVRGRIKNVLIDLRALLAAIGAPRCSIAVTMSITSRLLIS